MPPFSKTIADEGAAIKTFKLVDRGVYQEEGIIKLLTKPDTGSRGTRKLADNLSDLSAQVAAKQDQYVPKWAHKLFCFLNASVAFFYTVVLIVQIGTSGEHHARGTLSRTALQIIINLDAL